MGSRPGSEVEIGREPIEDGGGDMCMDVCMHACMHGEGGGGGAKEGGKEGRTVHGYGMDSKSYAKRRVELTSIPGACPARRSVPTSR